MVKFQHISGLWETEADIAREFADDSVLDYNIIIAVYEQWEYEGSAYVLAEKDGRLFEAHGGHCSCFGLEEGGFNPGEVNVAYLKNRLVKGQFSYYGGKDVAELVRQYVIENLPN